MPPRISRTTANRPKEAKTRTAGTSSRSAPKRSAKRALDAFAIASHEHPERIKIRKSRLGELEGPAPARKRARNEDEDEDGEDDEDEEDEGPKRRKHNRGDESVDEGSDSEGNNWTMGHVDDDDEDSDIDSDEAFGESDEERFEGWVFRGSASTQERNRKKKSSKGRKGADEDVDMDGEIDLDEGESGDEEEDSDDLGEDAIDLATALDQWEESEEEEKSKKGKKEKKAKKAKKSVSAFDDSDSEPSQEEDVGADGASDFSSSDDDNDEDEADKAARLRDLISSLPEDDEGRSKTRRKVEVHESGAPSEFGVMRKVDLLSFKPKITDPEKKKSLKLLQDDLKPSKRNDIARKLDAPLPKRQQDKLDRAVANEKANETLGRWVDTVKQNRRAEHISFPMVHPDAGKAMGESRLMPTTTAAPANDLESTIQSILQQSGLSNGKDDEEIQKWEELQTNKLPLEEVAKRRALLRQERELLFREEVRARRIKKIKSKSYRRVHRKERERLQAKERDALKADGVDLSEDEREYNDRRRAEERMGSRHRESRWAKGVKESGRAAWDEDARTGVTEMARRNEELRRRIEGKEVRAEDEEGSDFSSEEEDDQDEDADPNEVMQKQLGRLQQNPFSTEGSTLSNMKFMRTAEAARKARNDEDVERIRRELAGEETNSDDEDENAGRAGRKKFAPATEMTFPNAQPVMGEFEERLASDDEEERNVAATNGLSNGSRKASSKASQPSSSKAASGSSNPYLAKAPKDKNASKEPTIIEPDALWKAQDTVTATAAQKPKSKSKSKTSKPSEDTEDLPEAKVSAPDADGWQTVTYNEDASDHGEEDDDENEGIDLNIFSRNQALTSQAFAGDNIESEFLAEKSLQIDSESSKTITTSLPGWGAWTGADLSSKERKNRGQKSVTKVQGIEANKRKDKNLERVIINEKKVKKNSKFLAGSVPFPFESREQYERSLRLPKGPEWSTKKVFQDATKPRVLVKQGVISALRKPLV